MGNFQRLNKPEFRALLDKTLFKTFFHSVEWHEFLENEFKWLKFEYYSYKNEALLVFGRIGKKLISLPFCEYGGPLLLKSGFNWRSFEEDVLSEFGKNIKIKVHPYSPDIPTVETALSSYFLSGLKNTSEQEIWGLIRKTLRHEIKHAQQQNIEIRPSKDLKEVRKFYDLYVANLRRKKTISYPWHLVQFLCQNASSELLLAFYKGKIVGGALFLQYNRISHYFLSATDHKYRNLGIAHLLIWEKIKSLINKDIVLDLGASPRGSKLEIFKQGWSNAEYPIYQIGIKRAEESFRSSKLIRFIWGLLPNFIIKKLSSYLIKYRL